MATSKTPKRATRVLAIASGGGHWEQLMLLRPAFEGVDATFCTTIEGLGARQELPETVIVPDCNRNEPLKIVLCAARLAMLMLRRRPDAIVSTGALPGGLAIVIGRMMRIRTLWVDSFANAEELSLAGAKFGRRADLCLSQWPEVAERSGVGYAGSLL